MLQASDVRLEKKRLLTASLSQENSLTEREWLRNYIKCSPHILWESERLLNWLLGTVCDEVGSFKTYFHYQEYQLLYHQNKLEYVDNEGVFKKILLDKYIIPCLPQTFTSSFLMMALMLQEELSSMYASGTAFLETPAIFYIRDPSDGEIFPIVVWRWYGNFLVKVHELNSTKYPSAFTHVYIPLESEHKD